MLTPLEEYRKRVQHKGHSKREYVKRKVSESISDLIENSQYGFTIAVLDKETNNYIDRDVAILSTKTTQEYEAANVIAPLGYGLEKGTLFKWEGNFWIIVKSMFRPDQPGFNGMAYRCTGELKWIDEETKELKIQPAYIRSGRITNAIGVTPDVNRVYDNLVLHDTDWNMVAATQQNLKLHPEMRFIIKGQAYRVTNVDNVSIDNVSIISLSDDHILDSDDKINMIAYSQDYDYKLQLQNKDGVEMFVGDIKELPIVVLNHGETVDEDIIVESLTPDIIETTGNKIVGRKTGEGIVRCYLAKNQTKYIDVPVKLFGDIEHPVQTPDVYIEGKDHIDWNTTEKYYLSNGAPVELDIKVKSKIKYTEKEIKDSNGQTIGKKISVEDKYSGTVIISATVDGKPIEKTVYIRAV